MVSPWQHFYSSVQAHHPPAKLATLAYDEKPIALLRLTEENYPWASGKYLIYEQELFTEAKFLLDALSVELSTPLAQNAVSIAPTVKNHITLLLPTGMPAEEFLLHLYGQDEFCYQWQEEEFA